MWLDDRMFSHNFIFSMTSCKTWFYLETSTVVHGFNGHEVIGEHDDVTLVFQLEDTVCLFGTLLLLDPIHFPKSEPCLLIGSVCQNGALLGASL